MFDAHVVDDLSDVVVTNPVEIANIDFGRDSYHARQIIEHLGLSTPMSAQDMLRFFAFQAELKDRLSLAERVADPTANPRPNGSRNNFAANAKLTRPMREFIAMMVEQGQPSGVIRAELKRIYGVDVSQSHMSHMRKRVFKDNTL